MLCLLMGAVNVARANDTTLDSLTTTDSNGLTWYFYVDDDGGAVITCSNWANGTSNRSSAKTATYTTADLVIPETLTYNDVTYTVKTIGYRAFYKCTAITSLTIPAGLDSIGEDALDGCTALAKFVLADGGTHYTLSDDGCVLYEDEGKTIAKIAPAATYTDYEIGSGVTAVGREAFAYCSKLTSVTVPTGVTDINPYNFRGCSALTKFAVADGNEVYSASSDGYFLLTDNGATVVRMVPGMSELTVTSGFTTIGEAASYGPTALTSVTIPGSVKTIGTYAFRDCTSLTTVTFEDTPSVDSIGYGVFYQCSKLNNFTLPASVEKIGDYAFDNCTSLTSFSIADDSKLTYIGRQAFYGTKITSFAVPASVTYIGTFAFYTRTTLTSLTFAEGSKLETIDQQAFRGCTGLTSVDLSNCTYLTSLGQSCFYNCTGLTSITLPSSITSLGNYCFYGCTKLASIDLSECTGLTSVSYACFYGCSALTSIEIPGTITSIDDYAFRGCAGFTSVDLSNFTSLKSLGLSSFNRCTSLTSITLPSSITSLGSNCFYMCSALKSIDLSDCTGLESLGQACFNYCTAMTSIYLPSSITSLGEYSLSGCTALDTLVCYAESIPTAADVALGSSDTGDYYMGNAQGATKLYVPPYAMDTWAKVYETDVWKDYYTDEDGTNSHLYPAYKLAVTSAGMATLALPFEATIPNGVECYTLGTKASDPADGVAYVSATAVASPLGQGTPVLVEGDEGKYHFLGTTPYSEDSSDSPVVAAQTTSVPQDGNGLVGTYEATTIYKTTTYSTSSSEEDEDTDTASDDDDSSTTTYYNYVLQNQSGNVRFYQVGASGKSVGQFRAWLQLEEDLLNSDSGTTSIAFVFNSSDEVTGISEAATTTTATSGIYYDLQGRRVKSPQKGGIYIHDGRKVIL